MRAAITATWKGRPVFAVGPVAKWGVVTERPDFPTDLVERYRTPLQCKAAAEERGGTTVRLYNGRSWRRMTVKPLAHGRYGARHVAVSLTTPLSIALDAIAAENGVTRAEAVRRCFRAFVYGTAVQLTGTPLKKTG